jgi:hypothetical protein
MEKKEDIGTTVVHQEERQYEDLKGDGVTRDYSGAVLVQDPVELRLVRKLDYRIMASHSQCFPKWILLTEPVACTLDYVLAQLP